MFIALEVKANRCLYHLQPSAVPGEVPISPLVHVPATEVLISKRATPLFERYFGRSHREPWTGFTAACMYRKPLGFGESLAYWLFFLQVDGYENELKCPIQTACSPPFVLKSVQFLSQPARLQIRTSLSRLACTGSVTRGVILQRNMPHKRLPAIYVQFRVRFLIQ